MRYTKLRYTTNTLYQKYIIQQRQACNRNKTKKETMYITKVIHKYLKLRKLTKAIEKKKLYKEKATIRKSRKEDKNK